MLNRKTLLIVLACLVVTACGGGGGGGGASGSSDSWAVGWEGSADLMALDLGGSQRAKPGAIGALEAN